MEDQQICLKWNGFHSSITTSFECLWEEQGLVDVTLASDGQCIRAHKVILSACSPFFKIMFETNPCQHPVIILQDIRFSEIESILTFVYKGEVNIDQTKLQSLLRAAETLQIRGLSGASEEVKQKLGAPKRLSTTDRTKESRPTTSDDSPPRKRHRSVLKSRSPPPPLTPTASAPTSHSSRRCSSPPLEPNPQSEETSEAAFPCQVEVIESESFSPSMMAVEEIFDQSNDDSMDLMAKNALMESEHITEIANQYEMSDLGNEGRFHVGMRYSSFTEFEKEYNTWMESGHHPMNINTSTVRRTPSENFPYTTITYTCKHYGKPRQRGANKRPKQKYYAKNCPVYVVLKKVRKSDMYELTHVNTEHNHPVSAEIRKQYADRRLQLSDTEMAEIVKLVEHNASVKTIVEYAAEHMGRLLTSNDVHNLKLRANLVKPVEEKPKPKFSVDQLTLLKPPKSFLISN